jgi:NAD(P)H-hydrate repair Nnr-like enzyme with NAD(P)H-hydrate dehydratase domain
MTEPEFSFQREQPLYPKTLYNRPVSRHGAGRLLVVGGHSGDFSMPTTIYQFAMAAGIGDCHVVLPDGLARLLAGAPGTYYVPQTTSGSLSPAALGRIIELAQESDAMALGAALSNNSETTILVEKIVSDAETPMIIFDEALPLLKHLMPALSKNPNILLILTMAEVFKVCSALGIPIRSTGDTGLVVKLRIIQNLLESVSCRLAVIGPDIITSSEKGLIVTPVNPSLLDNPSLVYSVLSVFWIQNKNDPAAGLATGAFILHRLSESVSGTSSTASLSHALELAIREE